MRRLLFVGGLISVFLLCLSVWHTRAPAQSGSASGGALPNVLGGLQDMVGFTKGTMVTQWNLQHAATTPYTTEDAPLNPPTVLGVAENVGTSVVSVIVSGQTLLNMTPSPPPTVGDTVCTTTTAPGVGSDSGGTGPCPAGTLTIGTVLATSPVTGLPAALWDGVPFLPTSSRPLIDFRISQGGLPLAAAAPPRGLCQVVPLGDTITLVGTVAEKPFATTCTVPANTLTTGKIIDFRAWVDILSGTTAPTLTFRAYYGGSIATGTFVPGTQFAAFAGSPQGPSVDRTGVIDLVLAAPSAPGTALTLYGSGMMLYPNSVRNSAVGGVLHTQNTSIDQTVFITVSSNNGTTGSSVQLLSLEAK